MAHWPVYLINGDRDRARLEACTAELARAGVAWSRVPAVNGRALTASELARVYDAEANRRRARHPMTGSEIGGYLSHLRAWRAIVASDAAGGVVLEDDFRVTGDLAGTLTALAADDGDWDIAKLFAFRPAARLLDPRWIGPGVRIGIPYRAPDTTLGYAIRVEAAERLLRLSQPFFRPVEEDHKFFWEKGLTVALIRPIPLSIGREDAAEAAVGELGEDATRADRRPGLVRAWRGVKYDAGYLARLHRLRLLGR